MKAYGKTKLELLSNDKTPSGKISRNNSNNSLNNGKLSRNNSSNNLSHDKISRSSSNNNLNKIEQKDNHTKKRSSPFKFVWEGLLSIFLCFLLSFLYFKYYIKEENKNIL